MVLRDASASKNHSVQKPLAELGGIPPLNGKNPLSSILWLLCMQGFFVCWLFYVQSISLLAFKCCPGNKLWKWLVTRCLYETD